MSKGLGKPQTGMESGTEFMEATGGGLPGLVKSGLEAAQTKVVEPLMAQAMRSIPSYQAAKLISPDLVPSVKAGVPILNLPLAAPEEKGIVPALSRMAQGFTTPGYRIASICRSKACSSSNVSWHWFSDTRND